MNRTTIAIVCWLVIASTLLSACQIALPSGQTVPADLLTAMPLPQVNTTTERAAMTSRSATDTAAGVTAEKSSPSAKAAAAPLLAAKPSTLAPVNIPLTPQSATSLTASEVFEQISPAVVFVETPAATGSGVWIEPGYLVTNAHVVWPFNEVRIVFPNGEEHLDVPLIGWDLVADVAVLGPLETDVLPISFGDGSELKIGSDIYLIGYPGEIEEFPQPTLTQGLLSRVRRWDTINLDFFQVDAAIAGGQSGGVLVTGGGDVVGISTFFFTEAGFGLVASSANFVPRIESLINHGDIPTLTERRPFGSTGERQQTITLTGDDDQRIFMLPPGRADDIEITITGDGFPNFVVSSLYGYDYTEADGSADGAHQTVEIAADMPYLVEVWHGSAFREKYELESSTPLIPLVDPDDDVVLTIGDTHLGNFDLPTDTDVYKIDLDEGDTIEVMADSLSIDPYLAISYETERRAATYEDDDSGGGIFGTNATLIFRAPAKDTYDIEVSSAYYGDEVGGYFLNIARAAEDAEVAEPTVERTFVASRYGKMERYTSDLTDFQILFPALWSETYDCSENATACYAGSIGTLAIIEDDLGDLGINDMGLDEYVDLLIDSLDKNLLGFELEARASFVTAQKQDAAKLTFTSRGGRYRTVRLIYLDESQIAFNAAFSAPEEQFDGLTGLFDYLMASFLIWNDELAAKDATAYLAEGQTFAEAGEDEAAVAAFTQTLLLDGSLVDAYLDRARANLRLGSVDAASQDLDAAIALAPENDFLRYTRGMFFYTQGNMTQARRDLKLAIAHNGEEPEYYNSSALVWAIMGQSTRALSDLETYAELVDDDMPPYVLDTRAYVYLRQGDHDRAIADYEAALAADFRSPYVLLGMGVAHIALGDVDEGNALIAEADNELTDEQIAEADPQLADLLARAAEQLAAHQ